MKKDDIKAIAKEVARMLSQGQTPAPPELKDSKGRRRRPVMKDGSFLLYCNKIDLAEFKRICKDILHKKYSEVFREKVNQVLKDAGVEPKDTD